MNCDRENNMIGRDLADALNKIPVLRYQKDPVVYIEDLYKRYPQGGEYGWFAFVTSKGTFAFWDIENKDWKLISVGELETIIGIDPNFLQEGDIPVWDATQEKFIIINLSIIGTEEY